MHFLLRFNDRRQLSGLRQAKVIHDGSDQCPYNLRHSPVNQLAGYSFR